MLELEKDPYVESSCSKLRSLGVKAFLFDLDDTLIDTNSIFLRHMWLYSEAVAHDLSLNPQFVFNRLSEINTEEYTRHGVDPAKWRIVTQKLGDELGNRQIAQDHYHHIEDIYRDEPDPLPGVLSLLSTLQSNGFLLGEVTHGKTDWSLWKNDMAGLTRYFNVIVAASVHGSKTKDHWLQAIDSLGVAPHECLITGDNLKGDTLPAIEIGARAFSLKSPWSVYREGEFPEKAISLSGLANFWDAVEKL